KLREWIGQIPEKRDRVLHFLGVEEPEPLVNVRRDGSPFERLLELAVGVPRSKENCHIRRPREPADASHSIAHRRRPEQADDFARHPLGGLRDALANDHADRSVTVRLATSALTPLFEFRRGLAVALCVKGDKATAVRRRFMRRRQPDTTYVPLKIQLKLRTPIVRVTNAFHVERR